MSLRRAMLAELSQTQREQMASYESNATGWFIVAAGAALPAAGETWHVVQLYTWPVWLFWLLFAVMLAVAILSTAVWMIGSEHMRHLGGTESAPAAEQR